MNIMIFDVTLLIVFVIFASFFLYKNRKNLGKEGPFYLYRTQWGVNLIEKIGTKYKKTLHFLSYISITIGYLLMAAIIWMIGKTFYLYLATPIARTIKAPPIMPIIPYFPKLFGLESMFPSLPFVHFIFAIAIAATVHEFSHGIFARKSNIKIKSTGFVFFKWFPALFGAFVEQDDEQMVKKSKFEQKAMLSAGVFANMIVTVLFFILMIWFFSFSFVPAGVVFSDYAYSPVKINEINSINEEFVQNLNLEEFVQTINGSEEIKIVSQNKSYLGFLGAIDEKTIVLYDDAPAINSEIGRVIVKINEVKINSFEDFENEFKKYKPYDTISISYLSSGTVKTKEITLGEHPEDSEKPWLGVVFRDTSDRSAILKEIAYFFTSIKPENVYFKDNIYYETKYPGFSEYIYYLFWWIVFLNFLIALMNMLPVGFLDGGRFFQLTLWEITGSEKFANKVFGNLTYIFLLMLAALMLKWVWILIF